jgi:hypothetical protein
MQKSDEQTKECRCKTQGDGPSRKYFEKSLVSCHSSSPLVNDVGPELGPRQPEDQNSILSAWCWIFLCQANQSAVENTTVSLRKNSAVSMRLLDFLRGQRHQSSLSSLEICSLLLTTVLPFSGTKQGEALLSKRNGRRIGGVGRILKQA